MNVGLYLFILCIPSLTTLLLLLLLLLSLPLSLSSFIFFVQHIYSYIPQTNHALRVYNIAAAMWLQCIVCTGKAISRNKLTSFILILSEVVAQS